MMNRNLFLFLALMAVATVKANQYYYAPLGPWGLESTVINAKAIRQDSADLKKVKNTSNKKDNKKSGEDEAKKSAEDDFEKAEEAIFHAVEEVEHAVEKAIDDEVETLYPHHKTKSEE
jgi:biopolymer transport protein ExbB/TolQ